MEESELPSLRQRGFLAPRACKYSPTVIAAALPHSCAEPIQTALDCYRNLSYEPLREQLEPPEVKVQRGFQ